MKLLPTTILTILSLFLMTSCGKPTHESVTEDAIEIMEEMAEILNSVDDEDSAKAAAKKLDKLVDRMEKIKKQQKELGDPSKEVEDELKKKYEERMKKAMSGMFKAMMKLQSKPELAKHIEASMKRLNEID